MGLQVAEAFVKIRPDTKAFGAELKSGVSGDVATLAKTFAGLAIGAAVLKSWRDGVNELKQAAAVSAQTANAIRATGGAANVTAAHVGELAERLSQMSGADDELIQSGTNLILTFKNVVNAGEGVNAILDRATTAALDLSTAGFGSMESASIMLGKALNDPVAGLTALQRAGVTFTAAQKATITSLVETGQTLEAQKVILAEIEAQVGGSAKAFGETLPGQLAKAQVAMDDTKAAMLAGLAPALEIGAKAAGSFAGWIQGLPGPLRTTAALAITTAAGFVALARPINEVITLIGRMRTGTAAATAITTANTAAQKANTLAVGTNVGALWAQNAATNATTAATGRLALAGKALRAAFLPFVAVLAAAAAAYYGFKNSVQVSVDATKMAQASTDDLVASYQKYTTATGEMGEINRRVYGELAKESIGTVVRLRDALAAAGEDTSGLDSIIRGYEQAQTDANAAMGLGADLVGDLGEATADAVTPMDALASAVGFAADAMERANSAWDEAVGKVTSLEEAQINLRGAYDDMLVAIDDANKAKGDEKTATDEVGQAIDDAEQQAIDYGKRVFDVYRQAGASGKAAADAQISALQGVLATLVPGSPLAQALGAYILQLASIPPDVNTTVTANTTQAASALGSVLSQIDRILNNASIFGSVSFSGSTSSPLTPVSGQFAEGGPVRAGRLYGVGERGPELFAPAVDGRILSHADSMRMAGGGGDTIINISVDAPGLDLATAPQVAKRIGSGVAEVLTRRSLAVAARTG